jgi:glycerate-2-kinase
MQIRQAAIDIFLAGVESVKPVNIIRRVVNLSGNILAINQLKFDISLINNIFLIGAGKASVYMAHEMETILGNRITDGHIVTKYKHLLPLKHTGVTEAGHPVPDENSLKGTAKLVSIAKGATKNDLVICLISGGGSSLLADLPEGCTLEDLKLVNEVLVKSGLNIGEMNVIRKHLSAVKGGGLIKAIAPASSVSLILSDVTGDRTDVIASGPTVPDPSTFSNALEIINQYQIENLLPVSIMRFLRDGLSGKNPETLKSGDDLMHRAHSIIIGNNAIALSGSAEKAQQLGYEPFVITNSIEGSTETIAHNLVELALKMQKERISEKTCLLFGGEPTIKVKAAGLGGRNQHLALIAAKLLENHSGITILSAGTDGTDGPTLAAGAVCDSNTMANAGKIKSEINRYINDYDSYHFFEEAGGLIITGPTQTNVMDIIVVLIN